MEPQAQPPDDFEDITPEEPPAPPTAKPLTASEKRYLWGRLAVLDRLTLSMSDFRGLSQRVEEHLGLGQARGIAVRALLADVPTPPATIYITEQEAQAYHRGIGEELRAVALDLTPFLGNWAFRAIAERLHQAWPDIDDHTPNFAHMCRYWQVRVTPKTEDVMLALVSEDILPATRLARSYTQVRDAACEMGVETTIDGIWLDDEDLQVDLLDELVSDVPRRAFDDPDGPLP